MSDTSADFDRLTAILAGRGLPAGTLTETEWDRLVALAARHDVAPLLYATLEQRAFRVPPAVGDALRKAYLTSAARSLRLSHELRQVLTSLKAARIPVIVLKGACLAESVYEDIALRPMGDADLLVRRNDVASALEALQGTGHVPAAPLDAAAEQTINDSAALSRPGGMRIDLHWTVVTPRYHGPFGEGDLEGLWARANPWTVAGVPVLILSPTDLLLHLCMHASVFHRFGELMLRSFLDMARVADRHRGTIEWDQFCARANRWGIANGVHLALRLATEWTDLAVPESALAALEADSVDEGTVEWARLKVLNGASPGMESEAVRLFGGAGLRDHALLLRVAAGPFLGFAGRVRREPGNAWRGLRGYSVRLMGTLVREGSAAWKLVRRDQSSAADARREARLREYLGWR